MAEAYYDGGPSRVRGLESRMPDGTERSGDFFIVDLWRKTGNSWQLAARFSSPAEPKSK